MCQPGLHISLGVYDRLWELLESACTELDLLLAEHASTEGRTGDSFGTYVDALRKRDELKSSLAMEEQKANLLEQLLTYFSLTLQAATPSLRVISEEAKKTRLGITSLVKQILIMLVICLVYHLEGRA